MTSRKLIGVERTINSYLKENNNLQKKIDIDAIPFEELKNIVFPKEDDPLLYDGYVLNTKQLDQLNGYLSEKINPDFDRYFYVLECYGIYE